MNLNLNYEGYENYLVETETDKSSEGKRYAFKFDNNYGALVIKNGGSYGHENDLWEVAVLHYYDDSRYCLTYATSITDNVEGYLTDEDVRNLLGKIKELI